MGDLSVTVSLNDQVVDDRVVSVRRMVRIGESAEAWVSFPGADIAAVRMGDCLSVRGRVLAEGDMLDISLGAVHVALEHTIRAKRPSEIWGLFDARFLVAAVLVIAVGSWFDAAEAWVDRQAPSSDVAFIRELHDTLQIVRNGDSRRRATTVPRSADVSGPRAAVQVMSDGPRHLPDDRVTGIGWNPWYRRAVPEDDDQIAEALERYEIDPEESGARWMLARAAYDADHFDEAAEHYQWLAEHYPDETDALVRLAWAEKRRGHHQAEMDIYRSVLEVDPSNPYALGGLAVALARLNRVDEAMDGVDELLVAAPDLPYTDLVISMVEALQGRDRQALDALRRAMARRGQLSEELQIELRRDIALDPALASLRGDRRLCILVSTYMWAAGPTPVR